MAINSRNKGAAFERKIANMFTEATGNKWARTPGSGAFATRTGMNKMQGDIFCEEDFLYLVECKAYEKVPLHLFSQELKSCLITKWLSKLIDQCILADKKAMLIFKENRGKIMIMYEIGTMDSTPHACYFKHNNRLFKFVQLDKFIKEGGLA